MKKICLINPPYNVEHEIEENIEHIGVAYIAGYLEARGIYADLYDCPYQAISLDELLTILKRKNYDIIGISTYFYNYLSVKRIIRCVKKNDPNSFVFVGGYLPTLSPERMSVDKKYIDCMVLGEGEITVYELIHTIICDGNWHTIDGISYINENELVFSAPRELVHKLDILPFPKRINKDKSVYTVITSRGCYGHCNFCGITEFYQRNKDYHTRNRTAENVVDELKKLIESCTNIEEIRFNDDNFSLSSANDKLWFSEFVKLIRKYNVKLRYTCLLRANDICISKESLEIFKEIGLRMVFIGIESFVQKDLDFYNKKVKVEENIKALQICDELNIRYQIGFMMFNPETTLESLISNIQCIENIEYNKKHKYYNKPISNSAVIVTEGAPLEKYVVNSGLRIHSSIGYKFRDEKVDKCYQIINSWFQYIDTISEFSFLEEKFENDNRIYELNEVRKIFYEIFYYDLHVLKKVASDLLSTKHIQDYYYDLTKDIEYIQKKYKKLKEIEKNDGLE